METSIIVLAGGRSVRLGHDKVFETVGGQTLLEKVVARVAPLGSELIIVTAGERTVPQLPDFPGAKLANDIYPGKGPLGGIYTGLQASAFFRNLVVAADMPFLVRPLLRHMIELAGGFDLVAPRINDLVEPLHSVYTKECLLPIERMLAQGELSVYKLLPMVRVRYVDAEEIERFDPGHVSFFNINTENDLETARELTGGEVGDD